MEIQNISLVNRATFVIEWDDGLVMEYDAADVQRHCPCILCSGRGVPELGVSIRSVEMVGNYGVTIRFTSGCSRGIYPLRQLRRFGRLARV